MLRELEERSVQFNPFDFSDGQRKRDVTRYFVFQRHSRVGNPPCRRDPRETLRDGNATEM